MSKARIRLIKILNPDVKIIMIFRHPVERAFSNAKMDLVKNRGIDFRPENEHYFLKHYQSQAEKYDYEKILKNWFSVFNRSQILILSLEDIEQKPFQVMEKTYNFLGRKINLNHDLFENPNAIVTKPMPKSHRSFLEMKTANTIRFWDNNSDIFRLD